MESRVRYADGEPAKIVAISTALHDGHPVVAVGTLGVVTRHTLTGSYSERQEATRPWDLVLDEGGIADIKLRKQVGHLQELLRSGRQRWSAKNEELNRVIAAEAHRVDEYRGKFVVAMNDLRSEKNHSAFLKVENTELKAQITQTVKELDEDLEKRVDTGALIKELRQNLFDQKTQCIAANGMIADLRKENQIMRTALARRDAEQAKVDILINGAKNRIDLAKENQIMRTALTHRDAEQAKLADAAAFNKDTIEQLRKGLRLEHEFGDDILEELVKVKETNTILASEVVALEKQLSEADTQSKKQLEAYEKLLVESLS
jgi:hypothetical protein